MSSSSPWATSSLYARLSGPRSVRALCIGAVVRPQHPRTLRVGCRRRDEQENAASKMLCELHRLLPLSSLAFSPTYRALTRLDNGVAL
jgi:hypothetical protein